MYLGVHVPEGYGNFVFCVCVCVYVRACMHVCRLELNMLHYCCIINPRCACARGLR